MNIDYTALQKTKEACHEELDMIVNKYNTDVYKRQDWT